MANSLWKISCCPVYNPVTGQFRTAEAVRRIDRRARQVDKQVNPTTAFTDNMWCRARNEITGRVISTEAHRD